MEFMEFITTMVQSPLNFVSLENARFILKTDKI